MDALEVHIFQFIKIERQIKAGASKEYEIQKQYEKKTDQWMTSDITGFFKEKRQNAMDLSFHIGVKQSADSYKETL